MTTYEVLRNKNNCKKVTIFRIYDNGTIAFQQETNGKSATPYTNCVPIKNFLYGVIKNMVYITNISALENVDIPALTNNHYDYEHFKAENERARRTVNKAIISGRRMGLVLKYTTGDEDFIPIVVGKNTQGQSPLYFYQNYQLIRYVTNFSKLKTYINNFYNIAVAQCDVVYNVT